MWFEEGWQYICFVHWFILLITKYLYYSVFANTKYYSFIKFPDIEYYSFMKIYKYRIPNTIRLWKFTNIEYQIVFVTSKSTNTEYRIVLFGPNYSLIPNKHYSVQLWYAWIRQRIFDVSNGAYSSLFPPFPFISPIFSTFLLKRPKPDKKIS